MVHAHLFPCPALGVAAATLKVMPPDLRTRSAKRPEESPDDLNVMYKVARAGFFNVLTFIMFVLVIQFNLFSIV